MFETATPDWLFPILLFAHSLPTEIIFYLSFCVVAIAVVFFFFAIVPLICQTLVLPDDVIIQFWQYYKGSCASSATVWTLKEAFNSCVLPFQTKVLNLHLPMLLWTLSIVDVLVPNGFVSQYDIRFYFYWTQWYIEVHCK